MKSDGEELSEQEKRRLHSKIKSYFKIESHETLLKFEEELEDINFMTEAVIIY